MDKRVFRVGKVFFLPIIFISSLSLIVPVTSKAANGHDLGSTVELLDLSLQELMVLQVTSVSRRSQRQFDAAAAIYTITRDDINDLGITSIPDALRMVPGMQVAKLNGNTWAMSARGFNYVFANKLLVLIDGRSVYSSLFSGVNWDVQNVMLEDIDRIEVIRGPGAALWGSNAVNGVINIITRHSEDTQNGIVTARVGTEEKVAGSVRYGGELGEETFYRIYAQGFDRDSRVWPDKGLPQNWKQNWAGKKANDGWHMKQLGFRLDHYLSANDELTVQGDIYSGITRPPYYIYDINSHNFQVKDNFDREQSGGNILARYKQLLGPTELIIKSYYESAVNDDLRLKEGRDTWDIEFQHSFYWGNAHHFIWGANYRVDWYDLDDRNKDFIAIENRNFNEELYSAFVQDAFELRPDLDITFSARIESNRVTGNEFQPNLRFAWTPDRNTTIWGAVSKAVKTPALSETSLTITNTSYHGIRTLQPLAGTPAMFSLSGNPKLDSEKLTAFDFGFRKQITNELSVDLAGYLNFYKDVTSYQDAGTCPATGGFIKSDALSQTQTICIDPNNLYPNPGPGPAMLPSVMSYPTILGNTLEVFTHGLELALDWQVQEWWRLRLNYSYINVDADSHRKDIFGDGNEDVVEGIAAKHTANLFSFMQLPEQWKLIIWLRFIDKLRLDPVYDVNNIKANINGDIKVSKEIKPGLEFAVVGQHLLDSKQLQFNEVFTGQMRTEVERSVYMQVRWAF